MKRKVVEQGGTTLMVSIPVKWARRYGVGKGDELEMEERGKELLISARAAPSMRKAEIDIRGIKEPYMIEWILSALYREGYDEIQVYYGDSKSLVQVQQTMKDLFVGFIIASQTEKSCVLRCISQDLEMEFDATLRRSWLVSFEMADSVLEYVRQGKFTKLNDLFTIERTCDQLINFCERILNKRGYSDCRKTCFMYTVVWNLERVVDCYKHLCRYLTEKENSKTKLSKEVIEIFERTNKLFHDYFDLFYKFDANQLCELNQERDNIRKNIRELTEIKNPAEIIVMGYLQNLALRILDFSISTVALNQKLIEK